MKRINSIFNIHSWKIITWISCLARDEDLKKLQVPDLSDLNSVAYAYFDELEKQLLKAKKESKEVKEERV